MLAAPIVVPASHRHLSIRNRPNLQLVPGGQQQPPGQPPKKKIQFQNPNQDNYDRNIRYAAQLQKEKGYRCIKKNELGENRVGIVAGSGNSINDPKVLEEIKRLVTEEKAFIFGCKQAIKLLHDKGFKVDYGVNMDPGAHIARPEKIFRAPGTKHIIASSSDPMLFKYLGSGKPFKEWIESISDEERKLIYKKTFHEFMTVMDYDALPPEELNPEILIFHSATGYKKEVELYETLFDDGHWMGGGFNVTNRAMAAAQFMGCSKIVLAGVDCGWRQGSSFYGDGTANRPGVDMFDNHKIDSKGWWSRPDMLASGCSLAKLARLKPKAIIELENLESQLAKHRRSMDNPLVTESAKPDIQKIVNRLTELVERQRAGINELPDVVFLGDTIPAALVQKDDEFINRCIPDHS